MQIVHQVVEGVQGLVQVERVLGLLKYVPRQCGPRPEGGKNDNGADLGVCGWKLERLRSLGVIGVFSFD